MFSSSNEAEVRQRLASFCSCRHPVSPRHPFDGTASTRKTSQDFGLDGRAGRNGLSSRCSETRFPPLDPPWLKNISTVAMQPEFADAKEFSFRLRELPPRLYRSVWLVNVVSPRLPSISTLTSQTEQLRLVRNSRSRPGSLWLWNRINRVPCFKNGCLIS